MGDTQDILMSHNALVHFLGSSMSTSSCNPLAGEGQGRSGAEEEEKNVDVCCRRGAQCCNIWSVLQHTQTRTNARTHSTACLRYVHLSSNTILSVAVSVLLVLLSEPFKFVKNINQFSRRTKSQKGGSVFKSFGRSF